MRRPATWLFSAAVIVLISGLIAFGRTPTRAQDATPGAIGGVSLTAGFPVAIHAGTCDAPVADPEHDLGVALPWGSDDDDEDDDESRGNPPPTLTLATDETVDATYDDLLDSPHVILVHQNPDVAGSYLACGELGGVVEDGELAITLRPLNDSGIAGVAILDEDEDETDVTVYVIGVAPPASGVATPVSTTGEVVTVSLTEFAIDMPTEIPAGPTTFAVTNNGTVDHNFEVEGEGIEEEFEANLAPGETQTLELDLEPGTYEVYCPVGDHRDQGMETELTVTE
jgi:plastocyanin